MKVLLVEDDVLLQSGIQEALRRDAWYCEAVGRAQEALQWFAASEYALVLLDLGLPDGNGLEVLKTWRHQNKNTPVIILTARDEVHDKVMGLDAGADDYLIKPFAITELLARMRSVLRRSEGISHDVLTSGLLTMNITHKTVHWAGQELKLNGQREYALLHRLLLRVDHIVARDLLLSDVYTWADSLNSNTLEVYIHHLRQKLPTGAIETVRGQGYRLSSACLSAV